MANTTKREKTVKELFIGECWDYLRDNFHKFNQSNQIKIALELCKKDIPQEMTGSFQVSQMPAIQKASGEASTVNLEFNIGTTNGASPPTKNSGHSEQTPFSD